MENSLGEGFIKKNVLEKIVREEIRMKPKSYFALKYIGLVLVLFLILVTSAFLFSYIIYTIRTSGELILLGFGWKGIEAFIILFPWIYLIIDCALLLALDWLLRQFSLAYRSPFVYIFASTLGVIFLVGYAINFTPFHESLLIRAKGSRLYGLGVLYNDIAISHLDDGIFRGTVVSVDGNRMVVCHDDFNPEEQETIIIPAELSSEKFRVGEYVFVAGDKGLDGVVKAYGISRMEN